MPSSGVTGRDSKALQGILEAEGYRVVCASDGRDALGALHGSPSPCCILLDLMMPNMNGWRFLDTLLQSRHKYVPVVVITAANEVPPDCEVLRKPLELDRLLMVVNDVMVVNDHCCDRRSSAPPV